MQLEYLTPLEIGIREGEEIGFRKGEELGLRKGEELGLRKGEMRGTILAMHAQKASRDATSKLLTQLYHLTVEEANQAIKALPELVWGGN